MKLNIRSKLIILIVSLISGLMLYSTYFVAKAVEDNLTAIFRTNLKNSLASVKNRYDRIAAETLQSAQSFAQMMTIVHNVKLKQRAVIQREVAKLKKVVEFDILEVCDNQGSVLVGEFGIGEYGENKTDSPLVQAALAGKAKINVEDRGDALLIKAGAPIRSKNEIVGVFNTGYFLDRSFLDRIKEITGMELFLFKKEKGGKEKIVTATLSEDKAKLQVIFDKILHQDYAQINIGDSSYITGAIPILNARGEPIGTIMAAFSSRQLIDTIAKMRKFLILIAVLGIIIACSIAYVFAKKITGPLHSLVQGTEKVATGDFEYSIETKTGDELEDLADSFNQMTKNLRKTTVSRDKLAKEVVERKKAEDEAKYAYATLKETQDQLIQVEKLRAVGQLASGVAHDVRNPLGIILQGVCYLENKIPQDKKDSYKVLTMMRSSIDKANKIVESLVDFSRAKRLDLVPEDVNAVLEEALTLVRSRPEFVNIKVIKEMKKDISKVLIDKNKMEQVFVNIFINAGLAMPKGGEIIVRSYEIAGPETKDADKGSGGTSGPDEKSVAVEIKDTGVGISEENLKKIFEPFFTTRIKKGGTGLGLSVCKNIVAMHKGRMHVESQVNKGTKITITLRMVKGSNVAKENINS